MGRGRTKVEGHGDGRGELRTRVDGKKSRGRRYRYHTASPYTFTRALPPPVSSARTHFNPFPTATEEIRSLNHMSLWDLATTRTSLS